MSPRTTRQGNFPVLGFSAGISGISGEAYYKISFRNTIASEIAFQYLTLYPVLVYNAAKCDFANKRVSKQDFENKLNTVDTLC